MSCCDFGNAPSDDACDDDGAPWTENEVQYLVELYRAQPSLWNQECSSYVSYDDRRRAYESIQEQISDLGVSVLQVIMKIHEVRKLYVEELKNIAKADVAGTTYEPRYRWFCELDDFLHPYLHVDEVEALEDIGNSSDGSYSSNYGAEDGRSTGACCSRSMADFCQSTTTPRHSCAVSLPSFRSTPRSPRTKNCGALNCPANLRSADAANSSAASSVKRAQSDPAGRSVAIIRTSSQPIKMSEQDVDESSSQSRLTTQKSCDEFDLFAKGVACRLKRMSPDAAARAKTEIQRVLTNVARDMEPNVRLAESESLDLELFNDCKCSVVSILAHSKARLCDGQESNVSVNADN